MRIYEAIRRTAINRLDSEVLLAHVLKKDRSWLIAHCDEELAEHQIKEFDELVERRKNHEPVAYITGEKEFYGRKFKVDKRVLIPRPATETLVDEVIGVLECWNIGMLEYSKITDADTDIVIFTNIFDVQQSEFSNQSSAINTQPPRESITIVDVGTGSGCIGITLALEIPNIKIICTDISEGALEVAKENARLHGVFDRISFQKSDLISNKLITNNYKLKTFIVVSNPPYISLNKQLPPDVADFEPKSALYAGTDGMDIVKKLYEQCKNDNNCLGCVLEIPHQLAKKITQ